MNSSTGVRPTATADQQSQFNLDRSKLSTYSEMDVSSPFAENVKQISVQNKPLGGKVISVQFCFLFPSNTNGYKNRQTPPKTNEVLTYQHALILIVTHTLKA